MPRWKTVLFGFIYAIFMLFTIAAVGEVAVRIASHFVVSFKSSPFRQYDPNIGIALLPNLNVEHHRGCFDGQVVTNHWGMRDRERKLEKDPHTFRIALIGDSVVEAVHVKPDEVMNIRLEQLAHQQGYDNVEVMAFGVEGIGTSQELLLYQEKVRQFHPDLVMLLFVGNDVMNNSSTIQPKVYGIHTWYAAYYDLGPDGQLVFRPVQTRPLNGIREFFELHSALTYYAERMWMRADIGGAKWDGISLQWGVYGDPPDHDWQQAWEVTEKVLTRMKETVNQDGAQFMVMVTPHFFDIDRDWKERFIKENGHIPPSFRPESYNERLRAIASRNQININFLAPYMQAYRDQHNLTWPYLSLTCDPHPSALGHEVEAEAMFQKLEEQHVLPAPEQAQAQLSPSKNENPARP
jgi:lysophospholipase L1-like esterase